MPSEIVKSQVNKQFSSFYLFTHLPDFCIFSLYFLLVSNNISHMEYTSKNSFVKFSLICSDIREVSSDVLVLKYARHHYGVSKILSQCLEEHGEQSTNMTPNIGHHVLIESQNCTQFDQILWIGVPNLYDFGYEQIKKFSSSSLKILKYSDPESIAYTIHGTGYGLDEKASFASQITGIQTALQTEQYPPSLKHIYIVESNYHRFKSICEIADVLLADYKQERGVYRLPTFDQGVRNVGMEVQNIDIQTKQHIFIAMPFDSGMDDIFYYGIQAPIHQHNLLCERIDNNEFTGDILAHIKQRIKTAFLVVADLSGMNPNVYLEVGYAWGVGKPVILLSKEGQEVKFDVQGEKRIIYRNIRDLSQQLSNTISCLKNHIQS